MEQDQKLEKDGAAALQQPKKRKLGFVELEDIAPDFEKRCMEPVDIDWGLDDPLVKLPKKSPRE